MDKLTVGVLEGAEMIGVGRTFMYDLNKRGVIPFIKAGNRTLVKVADIRRYVDSLPTKEARANG